MSAAAVDEDLVRVDNLDTLLFKMMIFSYFWQIRVFSSGVAKGRGRWSASPALRPMLPPSPLRFPPVAIFLSLFFSLLSRAPSSSPLCGLPRRRIRENSAQLLSRFAALEWGLATVALAPSWKQMLQSCPVQKGTREQLRAPGAHLAKERREFCRRPLKLHYAT